MLPADPYTALGGLGIKILAWIWKLFPSHKARAFVRIQVHAGFLRWDPPVVWDHGDGRFAVWAPFQFRIQNYDTGPVSIGEITYSPNRGSRASSIRLYAWDDRDIGPPVPGRESSKWIEYVIAGTFAARRRPKRLKVRLHIIGSGWHKLKIPLNAYKGHLGKIDATDLLSPSLVHHYEMRDVEGQCEVLACLGMGKAHTLGTWGWTDAADQILSRERNLYSTPVEIIGPKGKHSVTALSGGGNDRRHMDTCFLLADVYNRVRRPGDV